MTSVSIRAGESPTARQVYIGPLTLVFSYETIVAFALSGYGWCVSQNVWSKTTGKHLNQETPHGVYERVPYEIFQAKLELALQAVTVNAEATVAALRRYDMFDGPAPDLSNREAVERWMEQSC